MLERLSHHVYFMTNTPIDTLYLSPCTKVDNAVREQVKRFFADLFCIMPVFHNVARIQIIPYIIEVFYQLMIILFGFKLLRHLRQTGCFQHINNKHRVVRRKRSATLSDKVRMRNLVFVGSLYKGINTVVYIFLNRIVDRTLTVGGTCTVIVHS